VKPYHFEETKRRIAENDAVWTAVREAVENGKPFEQPESGPAPLRCRCGAPWWQHGGAGFMGRGPKGSGCVKYSRDVVDEHVWEVLASRDEPMMAAIRRAWRQARDRDRVPREEGEWGIGPSDTTSCPAWVGFRETRQFVRAPSSHGEADMGKLLHDAAMEQLKAVYPWRQFELPVVLDGLDTRNSKTDCYDELAAHSLDIKTAGDWMWDHIAESGPDEAVWEQVMIYALSLIRRGKAVRTVGLVYVHRDKGWSETFVRDYDEALAVRALERLGRMATSLDIWWAQAEAAREAAEEGTEPVLPPQPLPRHPERTGPTNDPLCKRCEARWTCWNVPEAERLKRSPESLTLLGREPADPAIEWVALDYEDKRKARLQAEKDEEQSRLLLEGIKPGTYGMAIIKVGSDKPKVNAYQRVPQLERYYSLPDGERPPLESLQPPLTNPKPKVTVSLVRAAKRQAAAKEALPPAPAAQPEEESA
jgi:hypothetical protein